jgi:hypothetical protein
VTDLVCNIGALAPDERQKHSERWQNLLGSLASAETLPAGWRLTFPLTVQRLSLLVDVIRNERLCCPFLEFAVGLAGSHDRLTLEMTGPEGTRELLAAELGLQAQHTQNVAGSPGSAPQ